MNPWTNGDGSDSQLMQLYKIGQSGGRNPIQETQYQQLLQQNGLPPNATPSSSSSSSGGNAAANALDLMKQAQTFQIQQNQPAIATLQATGTTLADQYNKLIADITKQGQAAFDTATSGENAYLASRGLLSQVGLGNNQLSQAQNTINTTNAANQQAALTAGANTQSQIAQQVAQLQAGNVPQAENFAGGLASTQAGITEQNIIAQEALQAAQLKAATPFAVGNLVFHPSNNTFSQPQTGGGGTDAVMRALTILQSKQKQPMASIGQFIQPS